MFKNFRSLKLKNSVQQKAIIIQALNDCSVICNQCYYACFREEDVKMLSACIQVNRICAEICDLTSGWVSVAKRNDELSIELKKLCVKSCDSCADECEKHLYDHCTLCAKACRKCSEVCIS